MTEAVALASRPPVEETLLKSLAAAEQREAPYRNWRLSNVFPDATAKALAELPIHAVDLAGVSGKRELHNDQRSYFAGEVLDKFPAARSVAEALQSEQVTSAIMAATGARLGGCYLRVEYAVDVSGFWLEPHTDLGVKTFTMLYYLGQDGQEDLGTDLYASHETWAERAPFDWNTAFIFVPSDNTWHGFEPRKIRTPRRSIIINYVTDEWRARDQLAFPSTPVA
ncbi:MAG: 2OG-Fe(II) oxygenase [Alphaproteobacteria bacterium]|nr:2OG-Fe(II) oxygenase [Alphaproteobacteria bacterium]